MNVIFLAPHYPPEMQQYTRGLAEVGARVFGVGDTPLGAIPTATRGHMADYLQVPSIMNEDDVMRRVLAWARGRRGDAVVGGSRQCFEAVSLSVTTCPQICHESFRGIFFE